MKTLRLLAGLLMLLAGLPAAHGQVTSTNLLGATVRTLPATSRQSIGAHEMPVSLTGLASGVYLVRLSTGEQIQTTRLVVQP